MTTIPPMPLDRPRTVAPVPLRFEDVTQDGRLVLEALPSALGPTVWHGVRDHDKAARACMKHGVVPILTRFVLEGTAGPFSANAPVEAEGTYRLAWADGVPPDGRRLMLDVWADLYGTIGRTYPPARRGPDYGKRALAGRVLAEHVFTRPFAPPGERRVTRLDFDGAPDIRATRPTPPTFESIAGIPEGASPLEARPRLDPMLITFGLVHTDGNMHVNSLVYLRVFEEAALRRFVDVGRGAALLGRAIDIAYRKPCFAGQTVRVVQRAFETDGRLGVVALLVDEKDAADETALATARPHAFARMMFEP